MGCVTGPTAGEPGVTGMPLVLGGVVGRGVVCGFGIRLLLGNGCCVVYPGDVVFGLTVVGCTVAGTVVVEGVTVVGVVVDGVTVVGVVVDCLVVVRVLSVCAEASPKASKPASV